MYWHTLYTQNAKTKRFVMVFRLLLWFTYSIVLCAHTGTHCTGHILHSTLCNCKNAHNILPNRFYVFSHENVKERKHRNIRKKCKIIEQQNWASWTKKKNYEMSVKKKDITATPIIRQTTKLNEKYSPCFTAI